MNEFLARNGLIALDSSSISGTFVVTGSSTFNGNITLIGNILNPSFSGNIQAGSSFSFYSSEGVISTGANLSINVGPNSGLTINKTNNITSTSGEINWIYINPPISRAFMPTSGTATMNGILLNLSINQSGGANGITRGIRIVPTLTSAWDFRAIEWTNNASTVSGSWGLYGSGSAPNYLSGSLGIGTTSPAFRLDINGSFRASGSITATSGSDYFDISHDITQPAQTGSQIYEVNITPTLRYTAPNQTQTALRVAATFSGSTALSSSQSNIIADFGSTSAGSQLVVNDITSGSIYMVNDVSGIPIIEANSNWDVFIYDYPNVVLRKTGSVIEVSGSLRLNGSSLDTAWTSYTPTWTALSTNPVIGNGIITGAYKIVGKTCFVRGRILMGSSTTYGSGAWLIGLPVPAINAYAIQLPTSLLNNSVAWYSGLMNGGRNGNTSYSEIQVQNTGGTADGISSTFPFAWGDTDELSFAGSYEIA